MWRSTPTPRRIQIETARGTPRSNSRTEGERLTLAWETPLTTVTDSRSWLAVLPEAEALAA